jgi:hypothetical protein
MTIGEINTNTIEGRLLVSALSRLTVRVDTDKTPDEVLAQCDEVQKQIYANCPLPVPDADPLPTFKQKLTALINSHSLESGSNTPDFVLAEYLVDCLATFDKASNKRERWYGKQLTPAGVSYP